jgi:hypothetical protein
MASFPIYIDEILHSIIMQLQTQKLSIQKEKVILIRSKK